MKVEYLQSVELGNSLIEVLNPITGEIHAIVSVLNYDVDTNKGLHVQGIDMTDFFIKNQFMGSSMQNFAANLTSYLQKSNHCVHTFSSHFPFTVYSK